MSRDIIPVPVATIDSGKYRTRHMPLAVEELTESIREQGLLEPIGVAQSGERYDLVYGERRLAACRQLGYTVLPAVVFGDSRHALVAAFSENIQRQNLNPVEEAVMLRRLLDTGLTQAALAKVLGKTQSYIAQKLRLEKLPRTVTSLMEGDKPIVTEGHARQLLRLCNLMDPDPKAPEYEHQFPALAFPRDGTSVAAYCQDKLAWRVLFRERDCTVRDLEELINQFEFSRCVTCLFSYIGECPHCLSGGRGIDTNAAWAQIAAEEEGRVLPAEFTTAASQLVAFGDFAVAVEEIKRLRTESLPNGPWTDDTLECLVSAEENLGEELREMIPSYLPNPLTRRAVIQYLKSPVVQRWLVRRA
jgi:ParB/RepB/Spo0J family partition protein